ncbi:hypothetical protein [Streptomyces sp. NPDC048243]|uniref:hypothetical protein n=1 Tax=Streptomyces sp. NPDC048243 TaxID=3365522 RepID=UPI0037194C26
MGRPIAHVAKDLGIHKEALRGCVRQARRTPVNATTGRPPPIGKSSGSSAGRTRS